MRDLYIPRYFEPEELVSPEVFSGFGDRALMFFDDRLLYSIDEIRKWFNKSVTVNNWKSGGPFSQRGLRTADVAGSGEFSQHRFGRAIDFDVVGLTADEVRREIFTHQHDAAFSDISRIELGVSWVHIDLANVDSSKGIVTFSKG
jgi:hypothetical protein